MEGTDAEQTAEKAKRCCFKTTLTEYANYPSAYNYQELYGYTTVRL